MDHKEIINILKHRILKSELSGNPKNEALNNLNYKFIQNLRPLYYSAGTGELSKTLGILEASFEGEIVTSVTYVEKLIKEVEEVMEGKREKTGWDFMDGDGGVEVLKEETLLWGVGQGESGRLPTSEIYALLKDWLEFLKEYYKRSFVPLEWIKEEYMEEAKKLQKPING